jgi:hypothetical protein
LLLRYSILTINNLKRRGWQLPNRCIICFKEEESIEYAKEIRAYIHNNTQNHIQPSTRYRRGDITMIMDKREHIQWRRLELTTDFVIWRERYARTNYCFFYTSGSGTWKTVQSHLVIVYIYGCVWMVRNNVVFTIAVLFSVSNHSNTKNKIENNSKTV